VRVDEQTITLGGSPVFYRAAAMDDPRAPDAPLPVYLHGVPTSSDDWVPFLEQTGGLAPDLIGFGRTGKAGNLDYTLGGLADFLEGVLEHLHLHDHAVQLVGHDWGGAVALAFAQRHPDNVERMVVMNTVPLGETGFRWHTCARLWRRPVLGELAMGATTKWLLARALRSGTTTDTAWPQARIDAVWHQFDQGTQRAILRLYRASDERFLARAGADLNTLTMPALVLWGKRDPWIPSDIADACHQALQNSTLEPVTDAGHWPWLDQPAVIDRVARFLRS
jgi:pimeloyl-ACP methyl ester carboxylesterase